MRNEDNTVNVNEEERFDSRPTDIPVIVIERDNGSSANPRHGMSGTPHGKSMPVLWSVVIILLIALAGAVLLYVFNRTDSGRLPVSVSDKENIEQLKSGYKASATGTTHSSDSILGVAMDFFTLDGLRASLETQMPDTTDNSLVLFMRSADYHPDGSVIGTMVLDGERIKSKNGTERLGYVALSKDGKPVTGVSESDRVADYVSGSGGSFFRQYVLLSDGTLPSDFHLHGKVERAAIGRMADGTLYYIVTRHKETMYDFSDAMREYGVVDAIYITGGNSYLFHRDSNGNVCMTDNTRSKISKYSESTPPAPLLVFRKDIR